MNLRPSGPDLRLVPTAASAWALAWWAAPGGPGVAGVAAVLCLAGGVGCWFAATRSRPGWAAAALPLALSASVLAAVAADAAGRRSGPVPGWAAERRTTQLEGRVSGDPLRLRPGRFGPAERYLVRLAAPVAYSAGRRAPAGAPVAVLGGPAWAGVHAGQWVRTRGRLSPADPGRRETASVVARGPPEVIDEGNRPWRAAQRLRTGLREACAGMAPDPAGLLPALVVGDTSRLPDPLRADLQAAGLTHLTAVSGANVAIVCGAALGLAAALGARRRVRLVLAGLALVGFVVLARPEPSVLRAGVMGAVGLVGLATARGGTTGVPALSGCVVLLLMIDPWLARSYGFALSVLATAGLLLLAPAWVRRLEAWMPRPLAVLLAAPAAAMALTAPVTVLLQPRVSLVAVPANLIAAPAVAPATLLGVLAAAVSVPAPPLATVPARLGGLGTSWIAGTAHRAAALPGGSVPWLPGLIGAGLLALALAVLVAATILRGAARAPAAAAVALLAAAGAGWWLGPRLPLPGGSSNWPPEGWQLVMCDVGQGDATVLRSGPRSAVLVDTGPDPARVDGCLRRLRVDRLDLVVLTHHHADHVAGLAGALRGRGRPEVLVSPLERPRAGAAGVRRAVAATGAQLVIASEGVNGTAGAGSRQVGWQVIWPRRAVLDPGDDAGDAINDASLVLLLRTQRLTVVALGDVETDAQRALAPRLAALGRVDVVKVAHHGSAAQYPGLYQRLAARVALIGVGPGNDYGHPSPGTVAMVSATGAVVLRTDTEGDLGVVSDGRRLSVRVGGRTRRDRALTRRSDDGTRG